MGPQLVHFEFTAMQRCCLCHDVSIYIFPSYYDKGANKSGMPGTLEAYPLSQLFYNYCVFIIPPLRHFTIFGQENAQNMRR